MNRLLIEGATVPCYLSTAERLHLLLAEGSRIAEPSDQVTTALSTYRGAVAFSIIGGALWALDGLQSESVTMGEKMMSEPLPPYQRIKINTINRNYYEYW
ncbi:MAG: hypothetical protein HDS95_03965 [Bacteroidales bacterium]|nr:hypothetical protein [Bacteroidales bacterium]